MKIALYESIEFGVIRPLDFEVFESDKESIRITEVLEVEFVYLDKSEINKQEIALIDQKITLEMAESESKLNHFKQKKQELLANGSDA